jgi:hypothetical protein
MPIQYAYCGWFAKGSSRLMKQRQVMFRLAEPITKGGKK